MLLPSSPSMVPTTAAPTVVVTVAPVADQLTLATISPTVSATTNGVAATITAYAWTVSGPATIADETTATPTITPTGGGVIGIACAATVDGIVYYAEAESFTVGKYVASLGRWLTLRVAIDYTAEATASWLAAGATPTTRTLGGYDHTSRNADRATAFGVVNGSGVQMQNDGSASNRVTGPMLYVLLQELLPGWTYGDAFVVQSELETPTFVDGAAYLGLCLCSEVPTSVAAGTYVATAGYERVAVATYKAFLDHTAGSVYTDNVSSGTTTLSGEISVQELVYDGTGVEYGVIYTDPAGSPPDPGSSTRIPVVAATPSDVGPVAWVTRRPGTAAENPANAYLAFTTHGNNANCIRYLERLWVWA